MQVQAHRRLSHQIFNFSSISELASMKKPKNSIQLPKSTRNTHKIANKSMLSLLGNLTSKVNMIFFIT